MGWWGGGGARWGLGGGRFRTGKADGLLAVPGRSQVPSAPFDFAWPIPPCTLSNVFGFAPFILPQRHVGGGAGFATDLADCPACDIHCGSRAFPVHALIIEGPIVFGSLTRSTEEFCDLPFKLKRYASKQLCHFQVSQMLRARVT